MQAAIKKEFGLTADLKAGQGGVFDVTIDGQKVYSKDVTQRFPTDAEVFKEVQKKRG